MTAAKALGGRDRGRGGVDALLGAVRGAGSGLSGLGPGRAPRVGVEAAVEFGWRKWLGSYGDFIGMQDLGLLLRRRTFISISYRGGGQGCRRRDVSGKSQ